MPALYPPVLDGVLISRQGLRRVRRHIHNGLDIGGVPEWSPVYAVADGVVAETCAPPSLRCSGYGKGVLVQHGEDFFSWYAHLNRIDVVPGQEVRGGSTVIGALGRTFGTAEDPGRTLAVPHLHLELQHAGFPFDSKDYRARYDVLQMYAANGWRVGADGRFTPVEPFAYMEPGVVALYDSDKVGGGSDLPVLVADPDLVKGYGSGLGRVLLCGGALVLLTCLAIRIMRHGRRVGGGFGDGKLVKFREGRGECPYCGGDLVCEMQRPQMCSSREAYEIIAPVIRRREVESLWVFMVDSRLSIIGHREVARGSLASVGGVTPADILRPAVRKGAYGILIVHNHPAGDPAASEEDALLTQRVQAAANVLGLRFLDHLVIGRRGKYFSFADAELI